MELPFRNFVATCAAVCFFAGISGTITVAEPPQFNRDIRPILADKCFACHGPDSGTREAELRLDTEEGAHEWAIVPGDAEASEVIARVASEDPDLRMPPAAAKKLPLTPPEIELLRAWIDSGAKFEPHWAYIPPQRPAVPKVHVAASIRGGDSHLGEFRLEGWPRNEIDRFLLARMTAEGVVPAAEADRATLIRRLSFDLTGLPPTQVEIDEFLADDRPDAYERLVDRLLTSPRYAERMATWWFDLVRFANTVGYHGDQDHRITPYRDYVIKSFNENLPFDEFTIEQLAGDLLPNPTMWQMVATGYNRVLQTTHEGGAQDGEYRAKYLSDRARNVSEVWMASSVGCAECHDHKFDPFTQEDHFRLQAFFADVDHSGNYQGLGRDGIPTPRPPEMLAWTLPLYEKCRKLDAEIAKLEASLVGLLNKDWEKRRAKLMKLKKRRVELEKQFVPTMITQATTPAEIRILPRGNWMDRSGPVVEPQAPQFMRQIDLKPGERATRLDLARWLVGRDHPLTARVVVNRLWKLYFGTGLSETLIDMGTRGEVPPNQELLDWLAVEFVESGWDMKHIIHLMVTTSAYRQSSLPRPELESLDPNNRLVARQLRFRLEAEQIRDNTLAVSGLLVNQLGGAIAKPYQPAGYYSALNFPEREYEPSTGEEQFRRGVYTHWQRQFLHPWLLAFDAPTREECTAERPISSTPCAALVLLNDPSFVEAARALAAKALEQDARGDEARLRWAWRQVLGREPNSSEVEQLVALLHRHRDEFAADPSAAESLVSVGISPRAEIADVAELAAWTSVSRVLLNLNETITRN